MNIKSLFKYKDCSNNIFSKIQLVNALTQKEIYLLNEKYIELGLFIRQVQVDNFGNELFPNKLFSERIFLSKKRQTLQEFYDEYYLKYKKRKNNGQNIRNNLQNNSYDISSEERNLENNLLDEELHNLSNQIKGVYNDCQHINIKKCKINDENFKKKIIEYIKEFSKFLTKNQYNNLFQKWKIKNYEIKEFNINSDINDLSQWRIPILKGFKSEIILFALPNILDKKASTENNEFDEEKKDINKIESNNIDESSDSENKESEDYFNNNKIFPAQNDSDED